MAGLDGLVVLAAGGAALLQHALDDAAGDLQAEARHGRPIRQRKDVGRFERFGVGVHERLSHVNAGEQAVDGRVHVERLERQRPAGGVQGAEAGLGVGRTENVLVGQLGQHSGHGGSPLE